MSLFQKLFSHFLRVRVKQPNCIISPLFSSIHAPQEYLYILSAKKELYFPIFAPDPISAYFPIFTHDPISTTDPIFAYFPIVTPDQIVTHDPISTHDPIFAPDPIFAYFHFCGFAFQVGL